MSAYLSRKNEFYGENLRRDEDDTTPKGRLGMAVGWRSKREGGLGEEVTWVTGYGR